MYRRVILILVALAAAVLLGFQHRRFMDLFADGGSAKQGWTLEEATAEWQLHPRDPYLQYVVLQLAGRQGGMETAANMVESWLGREAGAGRGSQVELFGLFTGALAVQESLQLDAMRGGPARGRPNWQRTPMTGKMGATTKSMVKTDQGADRPPPKPPDVAISALAGPGVKSHPWEQMLAGRRPDLSPLARDVPEDFYWLEFHSLRKLLEAMELSDLWGTHLFNQAAQEARTHQTGERLREQLAVETNRLLRPFYDLAVEEVGAAGSDLFLREGSDLTLLFRLKQPDLFKARMDGFLEDAKRDHADARRTTGTILGVDYVHVETPGREVNVYSAYPSRDLHIRSNSKVAFEHILEAVQGRTADGSQVRRLGDAAEFAFIRTLMPRGAPEEDGFVYLSDPFIRRLVGPQVKLTERRRMLCYNHLRMIGHAALLYRTEHGRAPRSLDEMAKAECCPGRFNEEALRCPDGGRYTLSADGTAGVCSHHGHARLLTPCCEIPVEKVSADEAAEYQAFVAQYNQYWRTYFDPIALRLQVTPERYRLETIVLPLIDNSVYTGMARVFGGRPEPLDALPVPKGNIFSVAVGLNKRDLLREAGFPVETTTAPTPERPDPLGAPDFQCANNLRQIVLAMHNYHDAYRRLPPVGLPAPGAPEGKAAKSLLSWRVHLLPFLEQQSLYDQFHLNEPWDSEHNKTLVPLMPVIYRCPRQKAVVSGKTTYLVPVGKDMMFTGGPEGLTLGEVAGQDGTSNTIMLVEGSEQAAVPWTKPEDLKIDPKHPAAGLGHVHSGIYSVMFADGSLHFLRDTIDAGTLYALFTRNGGEPVHLEGKEIQPPSSPGQARDFRGFMGLGLPGVGPEEMKRFQEFLSRGIGRQVGFHVYDAQPMVDFNLPAFLGMLAGTFNGRTPGPRGAELWISFLVASLNAPVYLSLPVEDEKAVDRFLETLDGFLARYAPQAARENGMWGLELGYYQLKPPRDGEPPVRSFNVRFGPVKWRIFWARIGRGLYIASKRFILDDLRAASAAEAGDPGPAAHAMLRVRPEHWKQVLADFRLGWAENNRQACFGNLAPLTGVARALAPTPGGDRTGQAERVRAQTERLYTVHFFCPEGGTYRLASDDKAMECSVHGTALAPRQPSAPAEGTALTRLLDTFGGLTASLTFREDGLHAVVMLERK